MTKLEMIELIDRICEEEGYEGGPAYDFICNECCICRDENDIEEIIRKELADFNR